MRYLCFIILFVSGCTLHGQNKIDLHIPDSVMVEKTAAHKQFAGLSISMVPPQGYRFGAEDHTLWKEGYLAVRVVEFPTAFEAAMKKTSAMLEEMKKELEGKGISSKPVYEKKFKLGQNAAWIICLRDADTSKRLYGFIMVTGNSKFSAIVSGAMPAKNTALRDSLVQSLLTLHIDESGAYEVEKPFSVDLSGTSFALANYMPGTFTYTSDGRMEPGRIADVLAITATQRPISDSAELLIQSFFPEISVDLGIKVEDSHFSKELRNGLMVYEITFSGSLNGKDVYGIFLVTGDKKIILSLAAVTTTVALLDDCKKIARTLRVK